MWAITFRTHQESKNFWRFQVSCAWEISNSSNWALKFKGKMETHSLGEYLKLLNEPVISGQQVDWFIAQTDASKCETRMEYNLI